jgi:putative ATPase
LQPLTDEAIGTLVDRALRDERGLGGAVTLTADARAHLIRMAAGDARRALTALEAAAGTTADIDLPSLEQAVDTAAVRYDRDGDQHYDVISAFIKAIRGSDPDAALHYLARMIEAGEDPRFIARRLIVHASEDVGLADPSALLAATAAAQAVQLVGLPEARINLAQATIHLATAPKSNAVVRAIDAAMGDVRAGLAGAVPPALRDSHYPGARTLGHGSRYVYPHDLPSGVAEQQYPPDELIGRDYYEPSGRGAERELADRLAKLRAAVRGAGRQS